MRVALKSKFATSCSSLRFVIIGPRAVDYQAAHYSVCLAVSERVIGLNRKKPPGVSKQAKATIG